MVTVVITILVAVSAEESRVYTSCINREEIFHVDLDNLLVLETGLSFWNSGRFFSVPLYHPVRIAYYLLGLAYYLLIPVVYVSIYHFRRNHDRTLQGIIIFQIN